jgi:hypothetical protein
MRLRVQPYQAIMVLEQQTSREAQQLAKRFRRVLAASQADEEAQARKILYLCMCAEELLIRLSRRGHHRARIVALWLPEYDLASWYGGTE